MAQIFSPIDAPEIRGFLKSSLLDWDGKIVSVVFLPGCNMACRYCHNRGLVAEPEKYPAVPWSDVREHLAENSDFIDGLCVTGGEPTLHGGLAAMLREAKGMGLLTKLDTNGTRPDVLRSLVAEGLVDFVAMDLKAPLDERYAEVAGECDVDAVRESVAVVLGSGVAHEFRTTIVPGLHDARAMQRIAKAIGPAGHLVVQQLVCERAPDPSIRAMKPLSKEALEELASAAKPHVASVRVRGA